MEAQQNYNKEKIKNRTLKEEMQYMKQKRYLGFYGSDDEVLHHFCITGEDLPNSRFHRNINFGSWAYGKSPNKTMQCITAKFFRSRDLINESTEAEGTMGCTAGLGKTTSTGLSRRRN